MDRLLMFILSVAAVIASGGGVLLHAQGGMASPVREQVYQKAPSRLQRIPSIRLQDVAESAGLNFTHVSGDEVKKKYLLESTGSGVAIFDYDGDGLQDIFFVNGRKWDEKTTSLHSNRLYKNIGDLRFVDVTEKAGLLSYGWGQGVCVGDYDNDGNEDLFVTYYGSNVLYRNDGKGHFVDVTREAGLPVHGTRWNTGCTFFDYDRDGQLDIAVANYIDFDPKSTPLPGDAPCVFKGLPVVCGPRGLPSGKNILYRNIGGKFEDVSRESKFEAPTGHYCFTTIAGDFDDDGWPDVYLACDSTPSILFRNNHDGTFSDIGIPAGVALNESGQVQGSMGADAGDFDHSGRLSVVVTTFDDDIPALFLHGADGYYTDVSLRAGLGRSTDRVGWGTSFLDLDNDGWLEIFMANGHVYPNIDQLKQKSQFRQQKSLYYNQRDGTFADISLFSGPGPLIKSSARGLAVVDLDNNGLLELVVNNLGSSPNLFRNNQTVGNWIGFKLIGTVSNRDAIGARVRIKAGKLLQTSEVKGGCCYMSQSDMRLHFGLGPATAIEWVEVHWPRGLVERFTAPRINVFQVLKEGEGKSASSSH